jgi:membrane-associated phospholipid phosphatase
MHITALGDSAILLPCIALVALWLVIPKSTRWLAWRWLALVLGVLALVAASKLAFMGWMVTLPGLDFTGASGHSALAMLVWPALAGLVGKRRGALLQAMGVLLGILLALAVGWSRLALHAHSPSEVLLGLLLGGLATLTFLWTHRAVWRLPERSYVAALSLLLIVPPLYGERFPSVSLLSGVASHLSGHAAYTRQDLHLSRLPPHAVVGRALPAGS